MSSLRYFQKSLSQQFFSLEFMAMSHSLSPETRTDSLLAKPPICDWKGGSKSLPCLIQTDSLSRQQRLPNLFSLLCVSHLCITVAEGLSHSREERLILCQGFKEFQSFMAWKAWQNGHSGDGSLWCQLVFSDRLGSRKSTSEAEV